MSLFLITLQSNPEPFFGTGAAFLALTIVVVATRVISRPYMKIRLGVEDFFLVTATVFYTVAVSLSFAGMFWPLGSYVWNRGAKEAVAVNELESAYTVMELPFQLYWKVLFLC